MLKKLILKFKEIMIDSSSIFHKDRTLNEVLELQQFQSGETYSTSYIVMSGYVTNSTTALIVGFTFPKSIRGLTVTATSFIAEARGIKGYLNSKSGNQNLLASGYTVSVIKHDDHNVHINIVKSTAFTNVDNNTPITLAANVTFKFS